MALSGSLCVLGFLRTGHVTRHPLCKSFSTSRPRAKTAIVSGSARGIGEAIALRLARDGFDVTINDVSANEDLALEVVREIRATGTKAHLALADVADLQQVEDMIQSSVTALGPLDVMIANAGIAQVKPALSVTPEDFQRMFSINVLGVQNCFAAAARQIISQGTATRDRPAKMLAAASVAAFKPTALLSHYTASKWAVRGLTQGYALEMAEHNITVNAFAPGIVGTAMWDLIDEEMGKKRGEKLGEVVEKGETIKKFSRELIALGRTSVPEDVAKLVGFLCSRDSDYITGQTMVVDGGIVMT